MRSFDRAMPEERNRVLTDHLSELLLCSSEAAVENLRAESLAARAVVVGDVMVDVALRWQPAARANVDAPAAYGLQGGDYLLLTAHRAGNVDDPGRLRALVELIEALPAPVVFPVHPRTRARLHDAGLLADLQATDGLTLTEPLGYVEFSALLCQARAVLTDSGGVQKEAYLAGVPCVTLRANTEWVETVDVRLEHARRPRRRRRARRARSPATARASPALRRRARGGALCRGDRGAVSGPSSAAPPPSASWREPPARPSPPLRTRHYEPMSPFSAAIA